MDTTRRSVPANNGEARTFGLLVGETRHRLPNFILLVRPSEAYHTGADLNFGRPYEDRGMSIYACASGVVTFAARLGVWGNLIVIRHDPLFQPGGSVIFSRYAHVQSMRVQVGQRVARGERICEVGDAFGRFVPHLHFDLSSTTLFETRPGNWPKLDYNLLIANYIDPLQWIQRNRP